MCCAQYALRVKVLEGDMTRYSCFRKLPPSPAIKRTNLLLLPSLSVAPASPDSYPPTVIRACVRVCTEGYFDCCCCIRAGSMGESSCPELCLCLEACCCNSLAVSASRALVMDQYDIMSDPCDNRLINFNNCIQVGR